MHPLLRAFAPRPILRAMTAQGIQSRHIAVVALGVGVFFTAQAALMAYTARGRVDLEWDVAQELLYWLVWAALAPVLHVALMRWPVQARARGRAIAAHVTIGLALAALQTAIAFGAHLAVLVFLGTVSVTELPVWIARLRPSLVWGAFMGAFLYALVVGLDAAIRMRRLYAGARAEVLQSQLRPHFLFNALNAVSFLTVEAPATARAMVLRLAALLRRSFEETAREVPLSRELEHLEDYLEIQRLRFGDRLQISLHVADGTDQAVVPAFLLQPLVENAMEHAVALREQATVVTLRAERAGERLRIVVVDNGPGPSEGSVAHEGTGLSNVRELLAQLYGSSASIRFGPALPPSPPGGRVEVELPFIGTAP